MRKQIIEFELDWRLSNQAVDNIIKILIDEGAVNIDHDFKEE